MPISDIPTLSMRRTRMQWLQERRRLLAENVANADTPNYRARDLAPLDFGYTLRTAAVSLARTEAGHIAATGDAGLPFAEDPIATMRYARAATP